MAALGAGLALVLKRSQLRLQDQMSVSAQAQAEMRETALMRDHLLASTSHDLKTPLSTIRLLLHLLRRDAAKGALDAEHLRERLEMMELNVNRISSLIGELLDVARLQGGKPVQLQLADTDLVAVARKVVKAFEPDTPHHRIIVDTESDLLVGCWDADRLERMLQNLVGNAIKYSPGGSEVHIRLSRRGTTTAPLAVVEVTDRGVGIPPEDLARIFDWFNRGKNVEHIGGSGVGLASARQIAEKHGGRLTVESQLGEGSTFTLTLPMSSELREEVRPEPGASLEVVELPAEDRG